jgi:hypothetical protein
MINEEILLEVILLTQVLYSLVRSLFFYQYIVTNVTVFGQTSTALLMTRLLNYFLHFNGIMVLWRLKILFTQPPSLEWFYSLKVLAHFGSNELVDFSTYDTQILYRPLVGHCRFCIHQQSGIDHIAFVVESAGSCTVTAVPESADPCVVAAVPEPAIPCVVAAVPEAYRFLVH